MSEQTQPQIDPQTPVTLNLTLDAANGIIIALAKLPYEQSAGLIDNIRAQVIPQVQSAQSDKVAE